MASPKKYIEDLIKEAEDARRFFTNLCGISIPNTEFSGLDSQLLRNEIGIDDYKTRAIELLKPFSQDKIQSGKTTPPSAGFIQAQQKINDAAEIAKKSENEALERKKAQERAERSAKEKAAAQKSPPIMTLQDNEAAKSLLRRGILDGDKIHYAFTEDGYDFQIGDEPHPPLHLDLKNKKITIGNTELTFDEQGNVSLPDDILNFDVQKWSKKPISPDDSLLFDLFVNLIRIFQSCSEMKHWTVYLDLQKARLTSGKNPRDIKISSKDADDSKLLLAAEYGFDVNVDHDGRSPSEKKELRTKVEKIHAQLDKEAALDDELRVMVENSESVKPSNVIAKGHKIQRLYHEHYDSPGFQKQKVDLVGGLERYKSLINQFSELAKKHPDNKDVQKISKDLKGRLDSMETTVRKSETPTPSSKEARHISLGMGGVGG